jgi:HlyD family secretion protein
MSDIYRSEAVRKLRDPQQLDMAIRLTSTSGWLALAAVALIIAATVAWAFLGTLPYRVDGLGVILQRNSEIFPLQAAGSGRVTEVLVRPGERVAADQPLVRLRNIDTDQRLRAAERLLASLKSQRASRGTAIASEVAARSKVTEAAVAAYRRKIAELTQRIAYLEKRGSDERDDLARGLITRDTYETTLESLRNARQEVRSQEVAVSQTQTDQLDFEATSRRELSEIDQQILQAQNARDEVAVTVTEEQVVASPIAGDVTEVSVKVGDSVGAGVLLTTVIRVGEGLQMYAYLPVGKGKRVAPGMEALISPTTVERDIYGSINATVLEVSPLPASEAELTDRLGNAPLVSQLLEGGPSIELLVELKSDPQTASGVQWSSSVGPPLRITPGTTGLATVIVRRIRPVDLVIPIVKTWIGGS